MGFQGLAIAQGIGQGLQNAAQLGMGAFSSIKGLQHREGQLKAYEDRTKMLADKAFFQNFIKTVYNLPNGVEQFNQQRMTGVGPYQPTFTPNAAFLGTPSVTPTFQPSSDDLVGQE